MPAAIHSHQNSIGLCNSRDVSLIGKGLNLCSHLIWWWYLHQQVYVTVTGLWCQTAHRTAEPPLKVAYAFKPELRSDTTLYICCVQDKHYNVCRSCCKETFPGSCMCQPIHWSAPASFRGPGSSGNQVPHKLGTIPQVRLIYVKMFVTSSRLDENDFV